MDAVVSFIMNGATEWTPEIVIRLMLFVVAIEGVVSIARSLIYGMRVSKCQ